MSACERDSSKKRRRRLLAGPAASRVDFCSTPPASCSRARTTAAPRRARSPRAAGVTEYLLFRHFGSKAGLFREALVLPFTSIVDEFATTWQTVVPEETDEEELARHFVERVYDVVVEHRGLLLTLVASEAFSDEEIDRRGHRRHQAGTRGARSDQCRGHAVARNAFQPAGSARAFDDGDDRRHGRAAVDASSAPNRRRARRSSTNSSRRPCTASCTAATSRATAWRSPPRSAPSGPPRR